MKSKQIYLRPVTVEDAPIFLKSTTNQEIMRMTGTKQTFTLEQIEKFLQDIQNDETREDYAICLNETDVMVGELSILDIDLDNKLAGFRISMNDSKYLGKGLGTEAVRLIIDHVFVTLDLNRLQLEVFSHNPRGIRAYEKAGFIQEGVLREALLFDGIYSDEIIMAIIKRDYEKMKITNE